LELKKLKCGQCEVVADVYVNATQSIYRCKACGKLTRVIAHVEEAPKQEKPKKKRKKKDE
jgi:predicted nucleic acid-binding Zn ribbon protein